MGDDDIVFGERTFSTESQYRLGICLDTIMSGFYRLSKEVGLTFFEEITAVVFLSPDFESQIRYYLERSPLASQASIAGYNLLRNRNINNALTVLHSDAPDMKIWNIFSDAFCTFFLGRPMENNVVLNGYGTRAYNVIQLQLAANRHHLETVMSVYEHDCDEVVLNRVQSQGKPIPSRDNERYGRNKNKIPVRQGEIFRCRCGWQVFFDVMPPTKVLKCAPSSPFYFRKG